ncbi:kinase-like domain-containing protein, partial [Pisolithus marmoratus]
GSPGVIYATRNILSGSDIVAKLQDTECGWTLLYEYCIQKALTGSLGIPCVWWSGVDDSAKVLIIDWLGPSLEDCLSQQSSCMFSIGAVSILEHIHLNNFIHHHIKPSHLLFGYSAKQDHLYLVDFALAHAYHHSGTHHHIPNKKQLTFSGTPAFTSIRALQGREQSQQDDLESLAYVLMYLLCGSVPWQDDGLTIKEIIQAKERVPSSLLQGGVPVALVTFLEYTHTLAFDHQPNYDYIHSLVHDFCTCTDGCLSCT